MDFIISIIAHFAGLNAVQLKQIEDALPATRKLIDVSIQAQPLLEAAKPLVAEVIEEWKVVGPALETVLGVLLQHVKAGHTLNDGLTAVKLALRDKS